MWFISPVSFQNIHSRFDCEISFLDNNRSISPINQHFAKQVNALCTLIYHISFIIILHVCFFNY